MSRVIRLKDGTSVDLVGVGALVILGITIAFLVAQISPLVSLYKHPPEEVAATRNDQAAAKAYSDSLAWDRDQVRGRSLFFVPLKPDEILQPQQVAKKYEGPSISMFVNGTAYFSDGQKVSAAEPDSKTLHFVRADPPWSVRVKWNGTEFDVPIFEKTQLSSLASTLSGAYFSPGASSKPASSASPVTAEKEKPAIPPGPGAPGGGAESPQPPPPAVAGSGGPPPPGGGDAPAGGAPNGPPPPPPPANPPSEPSPSSPPAAPPPSSGGGSPQPQTAPPAPSGSPAPSPSEPQKEPGHPSSDHVSSKAP
jgi:hypothetical protein